MDDKTAKLLRLSPNLSLHISSFIQFNQFHNPPNYKEFVQQIHLFAFLWIRFLDFIGIENTFSAKAPNFAPFRSNYFSSLLTK